jgi:aspartate aminotransferase
MPHFENIPQLPEDPILHLPILFAADERPSKVNLGIGSYKDHLGKPMVLSCVRKAEKILLEQQLDKEYLPIVGLSDYITSSLELIFGPLQIPKEKLFAMQTVGGTNALRLGCELLCRNNIKKIFLSDPTWPNHWMIANHAKMEVGTYAYYDSQSQGLDFVGMRNSIKKMPPKSVLMLHASCHNPTGVDPSENQWRELSDLIKKHDLLPFFDIAYQGFGNGLEADAFAVRLFAQQGHEMLVASSYAKNLGLYGERAGLLAVISNGAKATSCISSNLKQIMRATNSVPPLHGARIAKTILKSSELKAEWETELGTMRERVKGMRHAFKNELMKHGTKRDLSFLTSQLGIFSFIGISFDEVKALRDNFAIYMPDNGRINVAGLNEKNLPYVASSVASVLKK